MNTTSPPSGFLRPPTSLGCCTGIVTMFQCLIQQFLNLFVDPERERDSEEDDADLNTPPSEQIGSEDYVDPVTNDSPSEPDALDSEEALSCRTDVMERIKDQVISRSPSDLKAVPIVGMGGIGKTFLAKTLYEDSVVSRQFHLRAWIVISQDYNLENVLLSLLRSVNPDRADKVSKKPDADLAQELYKCLKGRRFLIVLDDVWNVEIWNDFKWIFPNDDNGSRIILTSRLMEVAGYVEPNTTNRLDCLSNEESWRVLHDQVFDGEDCPSYLEEIGKEIAKKCQGLPLAIVVVGGYLSSIDKKQDSWADVAKSMDSLITGSEEQILDILYLSYDHLPRHLKACFLYMSIFPKNSEIHIQKLITLWSAVGILQSKDESEKCLKDLINRNLIMAKKKKYGRDRTCGIHDLLWDLSLREAQNEGHHVFDRFNPKHIQFNSTTYDVNHLLMYLTSSYLYLGDSFGTNFPCESICYSLLTVLDIQHQIFVDFPEIITNLVALRYLEICSHRISESVSKLVNLETLINWHGGSYELPREIFLLGRLRHFQARGAVYLKMIPGYCNYILETLSTISLDSCKYIVFSRIPNLKRLKIFEINESIHSNTLFNRLKGLVNLPQLEKLNLKFRFSKERRIRPQIPWWDLLPRCLKQLTLSGICLQWENMNILAELPNIEVLKLKDDAFVGRVYKQTVEGFTRLKVLVFDNLQLRWWKAEAVHYPVLQHLVLRQCYSLKEFPRCFEEIETLKSIELFRCRRSSEKFAKAIQEEQQGNGNYDLQLSITSVSNSKDELTESEYETTDSEDEIIPDEDPIDYGDLFNPQESLSLFYSLLARTLGLNMNRTGLGHEITDSTNMIYRTDLEVETTDSEDDICSSLLRLPRSGRSF